MSVESFLRPLLGVNLRKKADLRTDETWWNPDSEQIGLTVLTARKRNSVSVEQIQDEVPKCPLVVEFLMFHEVLVINYIDYIFPLLREILTPLL